MAQFFRRPNIGTAETSASFGWPLIQYACPEICQVVIVRDTADAIEAMAAQYDAAELPFDRQMLVAIFNRGARALEKISRLPGTLTLGYSELSVEDGCKKLFEFCLRRTFDREWWERLRDQKIEADLHRVVGYYWEHRDEIEGFKSLAKRELFRLARSGEIAHAFS